MGTILAFFQSLGIVPWSREVWKRSVMESTISWAHSFNKIPGIPSAPVALCSLIPTRSLSTPALDMVIGSISGVFAASGWMGSWSGIENTDEN